MRPVLWLWRGREVRSLAVLLCLGLLVGIVIGLWQANRAGLSPVAFWLAVVLLLPIALSGTRVAFLLDARRPWRWTGSGSFQYGALAAAPAAVPVSALVGLPFGAFADAVAVTALVAVVFGRIGCLLAGCCGGRPTARRVGLVLPDAAGLWCRRYPTQLMEAGYGAVMLAGALTWSGVAPFAGALALTVAGAYAAGRFLLAYLRADQPTGPARLTGTQAISLAIVAAALAGLSTLATI